MPHVITEKCLGEQYGACVEVCPVDCFHPGTYKGELFMVIDPLTCIDCGLCVPECPVGAIIPNLLTADRSDLMTTDDLASLATVGTHTVTLTFAGTGKVSYNLVSRHNIPWTALPPPSSSGPLSVSVAYDKTSIALDQTVAETVTLRNNTRTTENMILVTVGIPPGFAVVTGDLDTYETQQLLSSYELTARQLVLYVSSLKPSVVQTFVYHLQATMPVKASDGGTVASLYYQPDQKTTAPATTLEVLSPTGP